MQISLDELEQSAFRIAGILKEHDTIIVAKFGEPQFVVLSLARHNELRKLEALKSIRDSRHSLCEALADVQDKDAEFD